jgi:hypothetical protein
VALGQVVLPQLAVEQLLLPPSSHLQLSQLQLLLWPEVRRQLQQGAPQLDQQRLLVNC